MSAMPSVGSTRTVGSSTLRVEDLRILTGRGHYVDDVKLPGMLHAAFVRSPLAHARILRIDTSGAGRLDGVVAVFTGRDIAERTNAIVPKFVPDGYKYEPVFALATDKTRFVGDPVAIVVAESRYLAEDGCDLVDVDYEPLDAIATFEQALDPSGPTVFDSFGSNVAYETSTTYGDIAAAFAAADIVITETFAQHRVAQMPMEGRGGVGNFDPATGELVYYTGTQSPHTVKAYLSEALGVPLDLTRSVNGDIGGAFGLKIACHREDIAVCAASQWLGRPVKWIEDRNEHLQASGQAREERMRLEAAVSHDGTILAMRGDLVLDQGAYPAVPFVGGGIVDLVAMMMSGPYAWRAFAMTSTVVTSNKCTYSAYRAPWAIETWARERMIDVVARQLGLDPADVRLRNFAANDGSATMLSGDTLLDNSCAQSLERILDTADYRRLRAEQAAARAQGRCVGIGFATFIEPAPGPVNGKGGQEKSIARVEPDGTLSIFTSQAPNGQGHETTLAQIASDEMGVAIGDVHVYHGDTAASPYTAVGTGGSQAATMASGSVLHSTREVKRKVLAIAGDMLEIDPGDLLIEAGYVHPAGVSSVRLSLAQVAQMAYVSTDNQPPDVDKELRAEATYDGGIGSWSAGSHLCHVDIDLETGQVRFLRYLVVEDCGRMINPAIVEGQIRGGVAQGIGEVLYEWSAYDDEANYLAGTLMDYLLPTATEIPTIEIEHLENEPNEEVFYRGVGEGGLLVAPAAITNAIEDALSPFGARVTEQYLPPAKILELANVISEQVHAQ
ncbi:MAG TPA: xanthine dehydrogenase family protein molybdopterin-binding subunit [Micromonosporaceae bacterium]|nr:xanthine dehydrogenase family protein molybdopterin-binding subunit [Micromonosporaceae bacterium]